MLKVQFEHPTDGRTISVAVDPSISAEDVIAHLVAEEFITPNPQGYNLGLKGGALLRADQSLSDAGVKEGDIVRVLPATDAGK